MSEAKFHLVARASIIASGDSDDFHHVSDDEVVLVEAEALEQAQASATRGWEQADSLHMSVAEALRERDEARALIAAARDFKSGPDWATHRGHIEAVERERDEARRQLAAVGGYKAWTLDRAALYERAEKAERERDEAQSLLARVMGSDVDTLASTALLLEKVERERDEARAEAKEWQQHAALEPERAAVSMQRWMDITKQQQANAEKAEARVAELEAALRDIVAIGERCNCSGYLGPCGCGDRAEDCAREALEGGGK